MCHFDDSPPFLLADQKKMCVMSLFVFLSFFLANTIGTMTCKNNNPLDLPVYILLIS